MRSALRALAFLCLGLASCAPPNGPHRESGPGQHGIKGTVGYDQVKPVFAQYCAACHPARSGPDWLDYNQAKTYAANGMLMQRAVVQKTMPPPGSPQAAALSDEDRAKIGAWISAGAPEQSKAAPGEAPPEKSASAPSALVQQCFQCHGPRGPGPEAEPRIPRLGGQNENYMYHQLRNFKWRRRLDPTNAMNEVALGLNDGQMREAAHYFASQAGLPNDPVWTQEQMERDKHFSSIVFMDCGSCHLKSVRTSWNLPRLAGQSEQYLLNQLIYFRSGERRSPLMHEITKDMKDDELEQLALFFSSAR